MYAAGYDVTSATVAAVRIEAVPFHLLRRRSSGAYGPSIWEFLIMRTARSEHIWAVTSYHTRPQKSVSIFVQSEECHEYFFRSRHHAADSFLSLDNYYSCYWRDFGFKFQEKFPVCCSAIVLKPPPPHGIEIQAFIATAQSTAKLLISVAEDEIHINIKMLQRRMKTQETATV